MRDREENKKTKEDIYCCQSKHQRADKKNSEIDSLTKEYKLQVLFFYQIKKIPANNFNSSFFCFQIKAAHTTEAILFILLAYI